MQCMGMPTARAVIPSWPWPNLSKALLLVHGQAVKRITGDAVVINPNSKAPRGVSSNKALAAATQTRRHVAVHPLANKVSYATGPTSAEDAHDGEGAAVQGAIALGDADAAGLATENGEHANITLVQELTEQERTELIQAPQGVGRPTIQAKCPRGATLEQEGRHPLLNAVLSKGPAAKDDG